MSKDEADLVERMEAFLKDRADVQREYERSYKEHRGWCTNLQRLRNNLVAQRRLLVAELRLAPHFRKPFFRRSNLKMFIELQTAIDAVDRALPDEEIQLEAHQQSSEKIDKGWAEEEARLRIMCKAQSLSVG